ncbi:hypothetical protein D3C72_1070960 [compost metagenome]
MSTHGTGFAHGLVEAFRRTGAADHREIFDKTIEGDFGDHIGTRVNGTAGRHKGTLGDVDERVRLNAQVVHAAAVAVIQQARIAHMVASPFGHIADIHAATKRHNGQQQNQATHPILQRPVTENRRMAVGCSFCASSRIMLPDQTPSRASLAPTGFESITNQRSLANPVGARLARDETGSTADDFHDRRATGERHFLLVAQGFHQQSL